MGTVLTEKTITKDIALKIAFGLLIKNRPIIKETMYFFR
jgi:hypothetical protein